MTIVAHEDTARTLEHMGYTVLSPEAVQEIDPADVPEFIPVLGVLSTPLAEDGWLVIPPATPAAPAVSKMRLAFYIGQPVLALTYAALLLTDVLPLGGVR